MSNKSIIFLGALIVVTALFILNKSKSKKSSVQDEAEYSEEADVVSQPPKTLTAVSGDTTTALMSSSDATTAKTNPASSVSPAQMHRFMFHIEQMEKCLRLPKGSVAGLSSPGATEMIEALKPQLGEVVVNLEDWQQFDYVDKSGTKKRVRVDFEYPDGATPNRRLSMFTVNEYGALQIDNLTNDQADNPNVAYIESLKEEGQLTADEKSVRVYFNQGEELVYTTKNGMIDSFSMSRADRAYNCVNMLTENSMCTCP
jgi:hypothetical protein